MATTDKQARVLADFGEFVLANHEEITRRWVTVVDRSPEVAASEDLTYRQLLDHLPALCKELALTLKQPITDALRAQTSRDASAHGLKRWEQGYRLDELIRELFLIRQNFLETWPDLFANQDDSFDSDLKNSACRVAERFFDDVIIDSTIQFVEEQTEALRQIQAELVTLKHSAAAEAKSDLLRHVSHTLREPLTAIVLAAEALKIERTLSADGRDNVRIISRNAEAQGHNVAELLLAAELFAQGRAKSTKLTP
jgi:signal transduction histidine kinase